MTRFYLAASACLLISGAAMADDSSAALGAGGLVFMRSQDIRMVDEDLLVSPKTVRVRFAFANDSAHAIDTIVAFPLPDIDTSRFTHEALGLTTSDPVNFVGFKVSADGTAIRPSVEQRAFLNGHDVTAVIESAGLKVNAVTEWRELQHLSPMAKKRLSDAGLLDVSEGSDNFPLWLVRTRFYWRQHFPAGKTTVLEQSYQPVTGQAFFAEAELNGKSEDQRYYAKNFCIDAATKATLERMIVANRAANPQLGGLLNAYTTEYILSTGNNWKGPIGHFRLTLDKLKPDNALSLCWDGSVTKAGPTTFRFERDDFAPKQDVRLLVLDEKPPA